MSHKEISCLIIFVAPPYEEISCLLSHEKISCLKRKSHILSVLGPPLTRKSPVSCLMRKSHVSTENLMSYQFWVLPPNEKIYCLLSHEKIFCPKRKSHIFSVLGPPQRENLLSHVSRENLMSYQFGPPK